MRVQSHPALLAGEFERVLGTASDSEPTCCLGQLTYLFFSLLTHLQNGANNDTFEYFEEMTNHVRPDSF